VKDLVFRAYRAGARTASVHVLDVVRASERHALRALLFCLSPSLQHTSNIHHVRK
jgi:hypothetical protein